MTLERYGLIATSLSLFVLIGMRIEGCVFNITTSEPLGIYIYSPSQLRRGDMVTLRSMLKHAAGQPGDTIRTTPEGSYINGNLWPHSGIPKDTHGYRPYPYTTIVLKPWQWWLLGTDDDSWDSRWQGCFTSDLIAFKVRPLWVEDRARR